MHIHTRTDKHTYFYAHVHRLLRGKILVCADTSCPRYHFKRIKINGSRLACYLNMGISKPLCVSVPFVWPLGTQDLARSKPLIPKGTDHTRSIACVEHPHSKRILFSIYSIRIRSAVRYGKSRNLRCREQRHVA